jgi:hypothetical protein
VRALANHIGARWVSDHLCWTGVDGLHTYDLLPIPLSERTLSYVAERVRTVQDVLGRRLVLENAAGYVAFAESSMPEWEFLGRLAEDTGCRLLLDVSNIHVSAFNLGFDALTYINSIPLGSVVEIHLAGHQDLETYLLDTHDTAVSGLVWQLYFDACRRLGPISTVLEWDVDVPTLSVLKAELDKAAQLRRQACDDSGPVPALLDPRVSHRKVGPCDPGRNAVTGRELLEVQRAIQAAIVDQIGTFDEASEAELFEHPSSIVRPLTYQNGLEIYALNYRDRSLESLHASYPILEELIGDSFRALAASYFRKCAAYTSDGQQLSDGFPAFLVQFGLPDARQLEIVLEVATFELALKKVRDNVGLGKPATGLRLLNLNYGPYLKTFCDRAQCKLDWCGRRSKYIAIHRSGFKLRVVYLERAEYTRLQGLVDGLAPGEAPTQCTKFEIDIPSHSAKRMRRSAKSLREFDR